MSNKQFRQELEDIFNAIPKDGSNIKDGDDDDNNGYSDLGGDTSVPFETKASEVGGKTAAIPSGPVLKTPAPAPEPEKAAEPVAEKKSVVELEAVLGEAVAEKPPVVGPQYDDLDGAGVGRKPLKVEELSDDALPPYERDPASIAHVIGRGSGVPTSIVEGEEIAVPPFENHGDVVIPPTSVLHLPAPDVSPAKVEEKVAEAVKVEAGTVDRDNSDKDSGDTKVKSEPVADDNSDEDDGFDSDGWKVTTNVKQFEEFYANKRWALKRLLPNGRLPFKRWERELSESKAVVECSYDTTAMFEQMKFVQSLKVRVTEIIVQLNSQYFKWKRFMAILRADAARMEGTKVAQGDSAALRHLRDFEDYFGDLEALMETAEQVIRNLESGWDTLNRGVTIVLQAQSHERGMTRYEPQGYVPPSKPLPQQHKPTTVQELEGFDTLDATADDPASPKKKGSDAWDVVKDFGGKYPRK